MIEKRTVLVTGAGGSIGAALVKALLDSSCLVKAFDIDEYELAKLASEVSSKRLSTHLGDVKDFADVEDAIRNTDIVIHAAAVKMVDISNQNPVPCIRTNIDGTLNLIKASLKVSVHKFLLISSDKAVDFAGVYGATKFIGERLVLWANSKKAGKFAVCRMGNVMQTRGNVFEIWETQKRKGVPLTVTHPEMERYFWDIRNAVNFVLKVLRIMDGGEVFIPKMPSFKIMDLAKSIPNIKGIKVTEIRPDEVLHAKLYSEHEESRLVDKGDMWVLKS